MSALKAIKVGNNKIWDNNNNRKLKPKLQHIEFYYLNIVNN